MYQIFLRFNSKTYTFDVTNSKSIVDLKWDICQKFNLPYQSCDMCGDIKFSFYLTAGCNSIDNQYKTIKEFNEKNSHNLIEKETTIRVRINYHSKLFREKYIKPNYKELEFINDMYYNHQTL